ncbi:OmpW family protein [Daeguia caeni]|uniref:OmpW family protein n=1 Tax=Daeguia caeni TaxID=439612 RepID=A0ABV9H3M4_9HYPH
MKRFAKGILAGFALVMAGSTAMAADAVVAESVPVAEAVPAALSPWQIRLRALSVIPMNSGYVNGVAGSDLDYSKTITPELDITYYFTDNFAAELILGTTYSNINGAGSIEGLGKVGKVWILPPTLTAQYHFTNFGAFKPYVGAGINYTVFYNQKADAADDLKVKNTFGGALQVGFDYMINEHWGVNFDVKKLFLEPKFDVTVGGEKMSGKAKINPWLIGTGITYRF